MCGGSRAQRFVRFLNHFDPGRSSFPFQKRGCTMSLAQRVRDFRYSKGWGPDELASRASISRTALYQIESGKTELPRAGTLRRIALALDVTMESLLGHMEAGLPVRGRTPRSCRHGRGEISQTGSPRKGGPCRCQTPGKPCPRQFRAEMMRGL